jgi:hypothetical protein
VLAEGASLSVPMVFPRTGTQEFGILITVKDDQDVVNWIAEMASPEFLRLIERFMRSMTKSKRGSANAKSGR